MGGRVIVNVALVNVTTPMIMMLTRLFSCFYFACVAKMPDITQVVCRTRPFLSPPSFIGYRSERKQQTPNGFLLPAGSLAKGAGLLTSFLQEVSDWMASRF